MVPRSPTLDGPASGARAGEATLTHASGHRGAARALEWVLTLALDAQDLAAPPLRLPLAELEAVELGRGEGRALLRDGPGLRVEFPDPWASKAHARLLLQGAAWAVEDAGSKNGTHLNGRRVDRAPLADGDVLECGRTYFLVRLAQGPVPPLPWPAERPGDLQTLSPALERELALLPRLARSGLPILVRGESGTGKEVAAGAVHRLSGRRGPLVAVNCGAIPASLVESELFGSRRGAFSGAEDRPGRVRSAEGGTLFLDEVAELPVPAQASLLRLLQEREVTPLGGDATVQVDVRVVAATHQPLEDLVEAGRFRRDLFARLRGYELRLPPLSARLEDLGLLAAALLSRIEPGRVPRTLSRDAARALFAHDWPYHVRELEQVLRAAVAIATGPELDVGALRLGGGSPRAPDAGAPAPAAPLDERARLVAALEAHRGNLSAVARALVTSRTQVQRLLQRHGLDLAAFRAPS